MVKLQHHVQFDFDLDMSRFSGMDDRRHTRRKHRVHYRLAGVMEHIGGPASGHYVTFRRVTSQERGSTQVGWVYTSDTSVTPLSAPSLHRVLKAQAYMLLYELQTHP